MYKLIISAFCFLFATFSFAAESDLEAELEDLKSELKDVMEELQNLRGDLHGGRGAILGAPHIEIHGLNRASLGIFLENDGDRLLVTGFTPRSAAKKSGIQAGDHIVSIDDEDLTDEHAQVEHLIEYLEAIEPGNEVDIKVERDNVTMEFAVETRPMGDMGEMFGFDVDDAHSMRDRIMPWLRGGAIPQTEIFIDRERVWDDGRGAPRRGDVQVADLNEDLGAYFDVDAGVLVLDAAEDSELRAGDVIVAVGDADVTSVEGLFDAIRSESGDVLINRDGREMQLDLSDALTGLRLEREVSVFSRDSRSRREHRRW